MLGHKTQKADAARSAASAFWVLVCLNTSGDSYNKNIAICLFAIAVTSNQANIAMYIAKLES